MASAKISFNINEVSYTLYFGMASTRIFQERSANEYLLLVKSGITEPTTADFDEIKTFANLIYSGMCNMADIRDEQRPGFIQSYELAETISGMPELSQKINDVWAESQPVKEMIERLNGAVLQDEKKSTNPKIGKKLKPTPQDS